MYRCHVQFYLLGHQQAIFDEIRDVYPLEHFDHDFFQCEQLNLDLAAHADVIFAELDGPDPAETLHELSTHMKSGCELILLATREQLSCLEYVLDRVTDVWTLPLPVWEARFRFQNWQRVYRQSKDLWQANQFIEVAMNASPGLVCFKDKDGIYQHVNDSFCTLVHKPREDVVGSTYADVCHTLQDNPDCVASDLNVMLLGRTCVSDEQLVIDGEQVLLTTYKSPLYDLDGSVMGTVDIAMDVTKVRAYEKVIWEKNQTLELLFSSLDCGVMCHSLDGKHIISVNHAALQLLGYDSQEELVAAGFDLVAPSVADGDKPRLRKAITSLKKLGDSENLEYMVRHKDGKILRILGNFKLLEKDGELIYQRFLLDVTEQRQAEAEKWAKKDLELRYQQQMFEIFYTFLANNIDDIYIMMDGEGEKIEFVTPNVERVMGIPQKALLEDPAKIRRARYLSGQEIDSLELAKMEPGMSLEKMETERLHQQTGEQKRFQESVYCVSLQGTKKIVVYISDRTKERKTQDSLTEALEMAKVASKAKSTFLSSISHDIRTPMNAIMGFITLLQEEAYDPECVIEYTQKISSASQHLLGLINDVLDMNKIESGNALLNISDVNLPEVIDELNTIIRPQAKAKNQDFVIHVDTLSNEFLLGDKLRINQILINILSNAVKYTHPGGRIELHVSELPQVRPNFCSLRFTIRDNGQGMSEAYQRVIFDPFTREQDTAWNQIHGSGLGMAITKNLVDLMGGSIKVDSQLGKGSTFTVELELRIQEREDDPKFWERHGISRMMIADDDEDICRNIVVKMSAAGVVTDFVTDGANAMEFIRAAGDRGEPYDLILLDWKMPRADGLKAAQLIHKLQPKVPIILCTAYDWADIKQEAMDAGIKHFLPKPFFLSSLKDAVRRIGGKKQEQSPTGGGKNILSGRHVLVVDDIDVNRMILSKILTSMGAKCDMAFDGQEAVDQFTASQPGEFDLIMMDIQMPRLNGYEATRAIRASGHPSAGQVAIIAMTANAFVDDIRDALDSGMDAHVAKPIVLEQLKRTIQEVLERKK